MATARPSPTAREPGQDVTSERLVGEALGILRRHELMGELSDDDIAAICGATVLTRCRPGQLILSPEDRPGQVHILAAGAVRVYRLTPNGRQLTLDICGEGTILGDLRLLGLDKGPDGYAEAIDAAVMLTVPAGELEPLVRRRPMIGVMLITFLSRRLRETERELEAMAYQRVGPRLAARLLDLGRRFGVETAQGTLIQVRLTQGELADLIGTTRETLAHAIAEFRTLDLIDSAHQRVVIRDIARLTEVARRSAGT